ncbi:hypothetical protein F5I97DRAFT_592139 [Phlebopus sp. FC_14]|nr:hypothetical protein F5I97DRAFT_592139 [Phlebopus sp. FC_14]
MDAVGKHCALQSCNALDFLPIQCSCLKSFCRFHISRDHHDCTAVSTSQLPTQRRESRENDDVRSAVVGCSGCRLRFCVDHRHKQSHLCCDISQGKDEVKHEAARALLSEAFLSTSGSPTPQTPVVTRRSAKPSTDPKKLAQVRKIHLMKMRHQAVPGDPNDKGSNIHVDERLHVNVRTEITTPLPAERVLWFRKTVATGRALDLISAQFDFSTSSIHSLRLQSTSFSDGRERRVLQNHQLLSEQVEDGSVLILSVARESMS